MIINATQIRPGMILIIEGALYRVTWTMHRTPGKGNACMQTKLKHIVTGKNLEQRFLSTERAERAELETKELQYLYTDGTDYMFMDNRTFDEYRLAASVIEGAEKFLEEGAVYPATFFDGQPVGLELPKTIKFKVVTAPPQIKKATATNSMRAVTLENDLEILAPGFIKEGDTIRVNTETMEYVERVNE